jgi:acyl dehydratase
VRIYADLAGFGQAGGTELGTTDWLVVDQDRIDQFAAATGDPCAVESFVRWYLV